MNHLMFVATVLAAAVPFALLEIQIEGEEGWARGLPTWRYERPWTRRLFGNRAITGYHLWIHVFVLVVLHVPVALRLAPFSVDAELRLLAFWVLFWVAEDFLWFVFNPAWGLRSFKRERVWWHAANWWWFMPRDYWFFLPLGGILYASSL